MKYEYVIFFFSAKDENELKARISNNLFTIKKICNEYKKVFFIDVYSLKLFTKKNYINNKLFYDFNLGNHVKFISFTNYLRFINFLIGKKIVGISFGFGTSYSDLIINFIMGIFNIQHVQIQNVGNSQAISDENQNFLKKFFYFYLRDTLSRKITSFLSILGILQKIQIRFVSNPKTLINRQNIFFTKVRKKFNLFNVKEFILVNSRSYDIINENLFTVEKKYIVVLDEQLNEPQYLRFRNKFSDEDIRNHYYNFNKYLKKLSEDLKKEVVITIHPYDDLEYKKKIFKDFNVVKFRTREFIYKSYLVIFFESSAIIDALILNKNVTSVKSKIFDKNLSSDVDRYVKWLNLSYLNIDKPIDGLLNEENLVKQGIIKSEDILNVNYKEFLELYVCRSADKKPAYKKIIEEINKRYF